MFEPRVDQAETPVEPFTGSQPWGGRPSEVNSEECIFLLIGEEGGEAVVKFKGSLTCWWRCLDKLDDLVEVEEPHLSFECGISVYDRYCFIVGLVRCHADAWPFPPIHPIVDAFVRDGSVPRDEFVDDGPQFWWEVEEAMECHSRR